MPMHNPAMVPDVVHQNDTPQRPPCPRGAPIFHHLRFPLVLLLLIGYGTPLHAGNGGAADSAAASIPILTRRIKLSAVEAAGMLGIGLIISSGIDEVNRTPIIGAPPDIDTYFRDRIHDKGRTTNFLDSRGTAYTVAGGVAAMLLLERILDPTMHRRDAERELIIFGLGGITETGFRLGVKSTFARRRPRLEFAGPARRAMLDSETESHQSFYSGHTSAAFYTAAYADQAIGRLLHTRVEGHARILYRSLSFTTLYGWATYVGYSRMQIDQHYFTDVLTGGIVGTAWGLWYYRHHHGRGGHSRWSLRPAFTPERVGFMVSMPAPM